MKFDTIDELWLDAAQRVSLGAIVPSRIGPTKEIIGYQACLKDPFANFMFNPRRSLSPSYAAAEFIWYMSGENRIDRIVAYAPQYTKFANNGIAHGAYGARLTGCSEYSSLAYVIRILTKDPSSRQACINLWDNDKDLDHAEHRTRNDLPCTLCLNFLIRDNRLHLSVTMRSNDLWLGLPYDIFCWTSLQILVAQCLRVEVGEYYHQAMSLHCYEKDWEKVDESFGSFDTHSFSYIPEPGKVSDNVAEMVRQEEWNRKGRCWNPGNLHPGTLTYHLAALAASRWSDSPVRSFNGPLKKFIAEKREWER